MGSTQFGNFNFATYAMRTLPQALSKPGQSTDSFGSFSASGGIDQKTFSGSFRVMAGAKCQA
ncbi:MAG: hypothetical protein Q9211_004335 [Gyalolechia sp. 1 TL-2023]